MNQTSRIVATPNQPAEKPRPSPRHARIQEIKDAIGAAQDELLALGIETIVRYYHGKPPRPGA